MFSPPGNTSEPNLHQDLLDIADKSRSNPLAWNGQFSPQLIGALLSTYGKSSRTVFDPFAGSGTVAAEAIRAKKAFIGTEINPAAYILSRLYTLSNIALKDRIQSLKKASGLIEQALSAVPDAPVEPASLLSPAVRMTEECRVLHSAILLMAFKNGRETTSQQVARAIARTEKLIHSFDEALGDVRLKLADARHTGFPEDSCDMVITSPPYINVYNYHQQYRPIVEAMGCNPLMAASTEIGSNRKHRGNRFLTVVQYCLDIAQAALEISRVSEKNSKIIIVIGRESNVLGHAFKNAHLADEIFTSLLGWHSTLKQERCFTNRFGQRIYEEVLHYSNKKIMRTQLNLQSARDIGTRALSAALPNATSSSENLLNEAIEKSSLVMPSKIFEPSNTFPAYL